MAVGAEIQQVRCHTTDGHTLTPVVEVTDKFEWPLAIRSFIETAQAPVKQFSNVQGYEITFADESGEDLVLLVWDSLFGYSIHVREAYEHTTIDHKTWTEIYERGVDSSVKWSNTTSETIGDELTQTLANFIDDGNIKTLLLHGCDMMCAVRSITVVLYKKPDGSMVICGLDYSSQE